MQYLLFLLVFIAGSLTTVALDQFAARRRRVKANKELYARNLLILKLQAEGWQKPWAL